MFVSLALLLATAPMQDPPSQNPPVPGSTTVLGDVVVTGRRAEETARSFIADVAAPTRNRGLARWNTPLCVGVAGLQPAIAQPIVDRISDVAYSLGVEVGAPGCNANALIVATEDGAGMARGLVDAKPRTFKPGSLQMSQSDKELEAFQAASRPIRWWQISTPTNSETGERAIRLAGDVDNAGNPVAPRISSFGSRLTTSIRDDMSRVIIIADIDDISGLTVQQLSDYFAMVTLAQIASDAETADYDTILNLFAEPGTVSGLTEWDFAYLGGLYSASQARRNATQQTGAVASAIGSARREQVRETPEE